MKAVTFNNSSWQARQELGLKILSALVKHHADLNELVLVAALFDLHVNAITNAIAAQFQSTPIKLALVS